MTAKSLVLQRIGPLNNSTCLAGFVFWPVIQIFPFFNFAPVRASHASIRPFCCLKAGFKKYFHFPEKKCAKYLHSIIEVLIFVLSNKEIKSHLKFKIMANGTLVIGKAITMMIETPMGVAIRTEKMGRFSDLVEGLDSVVFRGLCKPAKLAKYQNLLAVAGFSVNAENWISNAGFEGKNSDVVNFQIVYSK